MVDDSAGEDSQPAVSEDVDIALERDRTLEGIVSTDFGVTALRQASVAALGLAAAGVVAWAVITYLQWHQLHQQGASASEQALGALEPVSILLFAAVLGLVGFGCRLAASWVGLRLRTVYLEESDSDEGEDAG